MFCARSRPVLLAVSGLVALLLASAEATACSCVYTSGRFLDSPETTLPAGSVGVLWWGPPLESLASSFRIARLDGDAETPLRVHLQPVVSERTELATQGGSDVLHLVRPEVGWEPAATYRLAFEPSDPHLRMRKPAGEPLSSHRLVVHVGSEPVPWPSKTKSASLIPRKMGREIVTTMTRSGSCDVDVSAAVVDLEMILPASLEPRREELLYSVFVDGKLWRPSRTLCSPTPAGRTWVGAGRARLFAVCPAEPELPFGRPVDSLEPGRHSVRLVAWRPGIAGSVEASTNIYLDCGLADARPGSASSASIPGRKATDQRHSLPR